MDISPYLIVAAFVVGAVIAAVLTTWMERNDARYRVWRVCQDHQAERYYTEHDPKNVTRWMEMLADQHERPCAWGTYTTMRRSDATQRTLGR